MRALLRNALESSASLKARCLISRGNIVRHWKTLPAVNKALLFIAVLSILGLADSRRSG